MVTENTSTGKALQSAKELFKAGELIKAEDICRDILKNDPENGEAHHILGIIADRNRNPELAVELINKAIRVSPNISIYYNNLGNAYVNLGNHEEAITSYRRAIDINHLFGEAHYNLGNALQKVDRPDEAIGSFKKAIQCRPDLVQAYYKMGQSLKELNFMELAIGALQQAVTMQRNYPRAHFLLAECLMDEGRLKEAAEHLKIAIHFKPDYSEAYVNLGRVYRSLGETESSLAMYRKALQLRPEFYQVYCYIAAMMNQRTGKPYYSADHPDIQKVRQLLGGNNLRTEDLIYLHFALGDMYDNCDLFDEAFNHFQQGNLLMHESTGYDMPSGEEYVDEIVNTFSADYFAGNKLQGSPSESPVFIVGLPRSGKTLTETLIAYHWQVISGGELVKLSNLISIDLPIKLKKKRGYLSVINDLDNQVISEIVREYEKVLSNIASGPDIRVLNTLPYSAFCLGMIAVLFPHARIIYCKRDALDNCLAIYCKYFGKGNEYAYDLEEVGFFCRLYESLMDHWQAVLPLQIQEVRYEELIARPRKTADSIIDFLGLVRDVEWSEHWNALKDNAGNKKLLTLPHNRFIGRAQKYKKYLTLLEKSLHEHAK